MSALPRSARPLLLLDVDGVLNPFVPGMVPEGFVEHRAGGMRLLLAAQHGEWLNRLAGSFELVWATTWEADANRHIGPMIGLSTLPFITFAPPDPTFEGYAPKLADVVVFAGARPLAWVDDNLGADVWAWARHRNEQLGIATLLIQTDPRIGLVEEAVEQLQAFADSLAADR